MADRTMAAREFRCRECGYPFRTAEKGWARDADLMCPACGSSDVTILVSGPRHGTTWTPIAGAATARPGRERR